MLLCKAAGRDQIFAAQKFEATSGIEPLNSCFADSCLAAWLRRRNLSKHPFDFAYYIFYFSQVPDSNLPRRQPSRNRANKSIPQIFKFSNV